ncbi:NADH dehydrogenase ubiquinone Fe-S protein 4 [Inquilinus sp. Marseille-Q2685]|uniref:NADH dehydrogenase ubiquinone Fe-S protein 4 n=1 Tax=Inquilinus sp. Marseille-Q2685 TaxID=2866581 RepID=UPI001CE4A315|nr:NADH dehydrogenase ubiquinone Fe-S protein 4 [Inquilinus sp. Marseille-Q2685]
MELRRGCETLQLVPATVSQGLPGNDNRQGRPADGRTAFPPDTVAHIFRPARAPLTSGRAASRDWRLVFERRRPGRVEPLMGWIAGDDPLAQIELRFPTAASAIAYAERQGLDHIVHDDRRAKPRAAEERTAAGARPAHEPIPNQAWLVWLHEGYGAGTAVDAANDAEAVRDAERADDGAVRTAAEGLADTVWTEYLADLATAEGMPENGRPSRLQEVSLALLALAAAGSAARPSAQRAA